MIDIVMTTFNRLDFTKKTIAYLVERTRTPFRLIIIDNLSTDNTYDFLLGCPHVSVVATTRKHNGIYKAKNFGLSQVKSELYVDTDNDILCPDLEPDWLAREIDFMNRHPEYAAVALRPQVFVGGLPGRPFEDCVEVKETTHCGGVLRMMRTELVRKVGGWPDEDTTRGHEEIYICGKLREMGYKVGYFVDMFAWHQFGDDDNWGYGGISLSEHGHNPIQPGSSFYDKIKCDPKTWRPL